MISYMSIDRIEGKFAVCEIELIWVELSKTEDYWKKETKMVDVPIDKFKDCESISEGDIFIAVHDDGAVVEVRCRDDEEKARRTALLQSIV